MEFHEDMSLYQSFYLEDYELLKIQDFREEVICIDADNDSYVPQKYAENFAGKLGAKKILINCAGHFNKKFGYTDFKELLNYL